MARAVDKCSFKLREFDRLRRKLGLTPRDLAAAAGVCLPTVDKLRKGGHVSMAVAAKVATALGVSLQTLVHSFADDNAATPAIAAQKAG